MLALTITIGGELAPQAGGERAQERLAVHVRHHQIRQHQARRLELCDRERLARARGPTDAVALVLEESDDQRDDLGVVVDHEDRSRRPHLAHQRSAERAPAPTASNRTPCLR
ncbi:MAG: hypothetical protein M5U28_54565 [Sandaracinaceae bacterium]|nr:hypothetical protein [Sandaracinaceae bacterium]